MTRTDITVKRSRIYMRVNENISLKFPQCYIQGLLVFHIMRFCLQFFGLASFLTAANQAKIIISNFFFYEGNYIYIMF